MASNIIQGAGGRQGAAYYDDAARIMLNSADRQSQILASQSALALRTIGAVGDSLSQGFSRYLDYKQSVKALEFQRELQLREAQRLDDQLDMQRVQLEDDHLTRQAQLASATMDLAQKRRDVDNAPLLAKSRAEASAMVFMAQQAAAKIQSGTATDDDYKTVEGSFGVLGMLGQRMISVGASPAELAELRNQLIPIVKDASTVTLSDQRVVSRGAARNLILDPTSEIGRKLMLEAVTNPAVASDPELPRNAEIMHKLMQHPEYVTGDQRSSEAAFKALFDSDLADKARTALSRMRVLAQNPEQYDRLRVAYFSSAGNDLERAALERATAELGQGARPGDVLTRAHLGGVASSGPEIWQGSPSFRAVSLTPETPLWGEKIKLAPERLAMAAVEGVSIFDLGEPGAPGVLARVGAGVVNPGHPILSAQMNAAGAVAGALGRFVSSASFEDQQEAVFLNSNNLLKLATEAAKNRNWESAAGYLDYLQKYGGEVKKRGGSDWANRSVLPPSAEPTIKALQNAASWSRYYSNYMRMWTDANARQIMDLDIQSQVAPVVPAAAPLAGASTP